MAGNKISVEDLIEEGIFQVGERYQKNLQPALEANKKWEATFDSVKSKLSELNSSMEGLGSTKGGTKDFTKGIKNTAKGMQDLNAVQKEMNRIARQTITLRARQSALGTDEAKKLATLREEIKALNQINREQGKLNAENVGAYQKLGAELSKARREAKDLGAEAIKLKDAFGGSSKQYRKANRQFEEATNKANKLDQNIKKLDATLGQHGRNVGNYPQKLRATIVTFKQFASALGMYSAAWTAARVARDSFRRARDFDRQLQDTAGIIGSTREEISDLEEVIKDVASRSIRTSVEVAELSQALVTLGKTKEEVKELLPVANDLSIALRSTSEEAGELLVQTLNAYKAGTDQADRYANIIASARQKTTLNFERIRDALGYIAPSAATLNIPLEETVAILGTLTNAGIRASTAGRVMRTAFGRLAKSGTSLATALEKVSNISEETLSTADLLGSIGEEGQAENLAKLGVVAEDFGQRAGPMALVLSRNREELEALTEAIREDTSALDTFINTQLKSLDSQLKILNSAWERYLLDVTESSGATKVFGGIIELLSHNLREIINFLAASLAGWAAYKTAVMLASIQQKALNIQTRTFNQLLRANLLGIIITGATLLYIAYKRLTTITERMIEDNKALSRTFNTTNEEIINSYAEIKELSKEMRYLTEDAKDNSEAQEDLHSVIEKLAGKVPEAALEFDKYGNIIKINTDLAREFLLTELETQKLVGEAAVESEEKIQENIKAQIKWRRERIEASKRYVKAEKAAMEESSKFAKAIAGIFVKQNEKRIAEYAAEIRELGKELDESTKRQEDFTEALVKTGDAASDIVLDGLNELLRLPNQDEVDRILDNLITPSDEAKEEVFQYINDLFKEIKQTEAEIAKIRAQASRVGYNDQTRMDIEKEQRDLRKLIDLWELLTGEKYNSIKASKKANNEALKALEAAYRVQNYVLEQYIKSQEDIASRDSLEYGTRLDAETEVLEKTLLLQANYFQESIEKTEEYNAEWIEQVRRRGVLTEEQEKKLNDVQTLAYQKYLQNRLDAYTRYADQQKSLEDAKADTTRNTALDTELAAESRAYRKREGLYAEYSKNSLKAKALYERRKQEIIIASNLAALKSELDYWQKTLETAQKAGVEVLIVLEKIAEIKLKIEELKEESISIDVNVEGAKTAVGILREIGQLTASIQEFGDVQYQNEIQRIEERQERMDEYYDNILNREQLTEAERERIEKKREQSQIASEKRIAREKRRQAEFDRAMSAVQAGINTALAITRVMDRPWLIPIIAATGLVQQAAIWSARLPSYALGTENHPGGPALIGEMQPEVVLEPNKKPYVTTGAEVKDLKKGTQVIPSIKEFNNIVQTAMLNGVIKDNAGLRSHQDVMGFGQYDRDMLEQLRMTNRLLKRQKGTTVKTQKVDIPHEVFRSKNINWG